jgi:hypothetical protein
MPSQPIIYVYVLEHRSAGHPLRPPAVFTWPNICRKYLKDIYADADGVLHLPPEEHRPLIRRVKVNPGASHAVIVHTVNIERFMDGKPY